MRRKLITLIVVAGIVTGVSIPAYRFHKKMRDEARAFAEDVVGETATTWNSQALYDRGTDVYRQYHDAMSTYRLCADARGRFGSVLSFEHPYGSLGVDFRKGFGVVVTGDYTVVGDFPGSKGSITIAVAKIGNEWKVDNIQIFPGLLPDYESHAAERAIAPGRPQDVDAGDAAAPQ